MMIICEKELSNKEIHEIKGISGKAVGSSKAKEIMEMFNEIYCSTRNAGKEMLWSILRASLTVYMHGYMEGVRAERNKHREVNTNDK